jgi:hypothetical protein
MSDMNEGRPPIVQGRRNAGQSTTEVRTWGHGVQGSYNVPRIAWVKTHAASKTANATSIKAAT